MTIREIQKQYGNWKILKELPRKIFPSGVKRMFLCECSCGQKKQVPLTRLERGDSTNCGCERNKQLGNFGKQKFVHGMSRSTIEKRRFYWVWNGMKERCLNRNNKSYKNYGGRGITIDEEWKEFKNFMIDMYDEYISHQQRHGRDTTIERVDNGLGYNKKNCIWTTHKKQNINRRPKHKYDTKKRTHNSWTL